MQTFKQYWMIILPAFLLLAGGGLYWVTFERSGGEAWDALKADESGAIASKTPFNQQALSNAPEEKREQSPGTELTAASRSELSTEDQKEPNRLAVDIKGAVRFPGLYYVEEGSRVYDVIQLAGTFTADADPSRINLAEKVIDGAVIYIPKKESTEQTIEREEQDGPNTAGTSRTTAPVVGSAIILPTGQHSLSGTQGGAGAVQGARLNINTAGLGELQSLPGIGPARAQAIIEYREKNGPFQDISELKKISGIGPKTFEKLQDKVTVGQ